MRSLLRRSLLNVWVSDLGFQNVIITSHLHRNKACNAGLYLRDLMRKCTGADKHDKREP